LYNFPLLTRLRQLFKRMAKICSVDQLPYVLPKTSEAKKEDLVEDEEGEEEEVAGRIAVTVVITEIVIEATTETEIMAATTTIEIVEILLMEITVDTETADLTTRKVTISKARTLTNSKAKAMANNKATVSNKATDNSSKATDSKPHTDNSKPHTDSSKPTSNQHNQRNPNKPMDNQQLQQQQQLTGVRINTILLRPAIQLLAQVKPHHQRNLTRRSNTSKDNTRNNILKHLRSQPASTRNPRPLNTPPPLQIKQRCHRNRTARGDAFNFPF